jgi:dTDP-4-amino-4,6-dideoxygalactose transaminase
MEGKNGRKAAGTTMTKIPFSRVECDGNELKYLAEVLASGWLTTGKVTLEFERQFAERVGARFACAVNSCTAALHLALEALGIGPGDKVLVPTWTFTATAEVVRYLGAEVVIVDVDADTGLVTPAIVREALERHPEARVLIVVHFAGQAAAMLNETDGIISICRDANVRVIEDAAHAFPAKEGDRMVGSLSDATCFSFYANKTITTGEGGMLTTNDEEIYRRCSLMRLHGIDRTVWDRFISTRPAWEYDVVAPGFKYNMPDLNAAVGLAQLERSEELRLRRQDSARRYREALQGCSGVRMLTCRVPPEAHAWHLFPIVLEGAGTDGRNHAIHWLADRGISTSVHYKPLHRLRYYRERYRLHPDSFPNAERIWNGCLSLPLHSWISDEEISRVVDALTRYLEGKDACRS